MILGVCPYCGVPIGDEVRERLIAWAKPKCDHCGKDFWLLCGDIRMPIETWTVEEWEKKYWLDGNIVTLIEPEEMGL